MSFLTTLCIALPVSLTTFFIFFTLVSLPYNLTGITRRTYYPAIRRLLLIHLSVLVISIIIVTYIAFNNTTLPVILFGLIADISLVSGIAATSVRELMNKDKSPCEDGLTTTSVILFSFFYIAFAPAISYTRLTSSLTDENRIY